MEITLKIKGEEKTYIADDPNIKHYLEALEIDKVARESDDDYETDVKVINDRLDLIVKMFDGQFTKDELMGGLKGKELDKTFYDIIGVEVLGYATREELEESQKQLGELTALVEKSENEKPSNESTSA